jgi:hypothetical protein
MNRKSGTSKTSATKLVKSIRRKTRQTYSAEEKIRIVLAGLRGEESISAGAVRQMRTGLCKDNMTVLYAAPSWRHSARAAVRLSLKLARE